MFLFEETRKWSQKDRVIYVLSRTRGRVPYKKTYKTGDKRHWVFIVLFISPFIHIYYIMYSQGTGEKVPGHDNPHKQSIDEDGPQTVLFSSYVDRLSVFG